MGAVKVSGFAYKAEAYDAATGMLNLRARQYEPAMNRFSQKDIVRGQVTSPLSLNRYAYCINDSVNLIDPSGKVLILTAAATAAVGAVSAIAASTAVKAVANFAKKAKSLTYNGDGTWTSNGGLPSGQVPAGTFDEAFVHYETLIDDQVTILAQQQLTDNIVSTFKDGYYRTVVTNEEIEVY